MSTADILRPSELGRRLSVLEMERNMTIMASPSSGVWSVKDLPFKAKGDGVHDDTDALDAACKAANAQYLATSLPQTVLLPVGVYSIRYFTLRSGVTLMGMGWSSALSARTNNRIVRLAPDGQSQTPCKEAGLVNLMILGNYSKNPAWATGDVNTSVQGIGLEGSADPDNTVLIQNVAVVDTRREGIYLERMNFKAKDLYLHGCGTGLETQGGGLSLKNCYDVVIDNVDASNIRGNFGLKILDPMAPWSCSNLKVTKPTAHGVVVSGGTQAGFMSKVTVENCPERPIHIMEGTENLTLSNVRAGMSTGHLPAITLHKTKNVVLTGVFTYGTPEGVMITGGVGYGNVRILGLFHNGATRLSVPDGCTGIKDLDVP